MRVPPITPQTDPKEYLQDLFKILHNIKFGDATNRSEEQNTDTCFLTGTTDAVAGTEKIFNHVLGRLPIGYIVINTDKAGPIFNGPTAWTTTTISLKSNSASQTFLAIIL